ncbi:hypothetical protein LCI18_001818 [Fusarium solani-melongenae]|uniref:Uncharacterized protein n=1 Tax=Fusarium solani subsp. cucurbitae TaxID=2747967 RepID=A0ACD3YPV4_FUSSC|nr:hypothetical protein LCI18_001818 [Fusarium solani-melongenae]
MEDSSIHPFEATHSQVSSESSTYTKSHEDNSSTTAESTSHLQSLPSIVKETAELSRLEQLPPELRLSILTTLNLDQVKNLIKSSPTFYQQYRHDRKFILGSALNTPLGSLTVDAYAVHLTSPANFDLVHPEDAIPRFLKDYQRLRSSLDFSLPEQGLTGNDMSDLAVFHFLVVQPFTKMYKNWAFANIANAFEDPKMTARTRPLTPTEEMRIMRGLYRFQLWCNLFGHSESVFDEVRILEMFFGVYEPWEVDEINSVHTFATEGFFTDLPWSLEQDVSSPRIFAADEFYIEFEPTYRGAQKEPGRKMYMKLNALYISLFNTINSCEYSRYNHLNRVLRQDTQVDRRIHYPSPRDQREQDLKPFPFKGDDLALRPAAWTDTWQGEYSNLFGDFMPESTAEWGLMMWDEARFREFGMYDVVWYTCRDKWPGYDPRDRFREDDDEEDSGDDWY